MLFYASHAAPSIKLVNTENAMQENAKIECTATCNSLLTWRLHTHNFMDDRNGRNWYEIVAINRSGNLCMETIALSSQWFAPSVNAVSVQCIAVYVCPTEACLHGICSSNIQGTYWVGICDVGTKLMIPIKYILYCSLLNYCFWSTYRCVHKRTW